MLHWACLFLMKYMPVYLFLFCIISSRCKELWWRTDNSERRGGVTEWKRRHQALLDWGNYTKQQLLVKMFVGHLWHCCVWLALYGLMHCKIQAFISGMPQWEQEDDWYVIRARNQCLFRNGQRGKANHLQPYPVRHARLAKRFARSTVHMILPRNARCALPKWTQWLIMGRCETPIPPEKNFWTKRAILGAFLSNEQGSKGVMKKKKVMGVWPLGDQARPSGGQPDWCPC